MKPKSAMFGGVAGEGEVQRELWRWRRCGGPGDDALAQAMVAGRELKAQAVPRSRPGEHLPGPERVDADRTSMRFGSQAQDRAKIPDRALPVVRAPRRSPGRSVLTLAPKFPLQTS